LGDDDFITLDYIPDDMVIGEQFPIGRDKEPSRGSHNLVILVVNEKLDDCGLACSHQRWDVRGKSGTANKGDENSQKPPPPYRKSRNQKWAHGA
jgi:hypothetical protein